MTFCRGFDKIELVKEREIKVIISEKMIGMNMTEFFDYASDFLKLARKDREAGNFYGAGQLISQYEKLVDDGLGFWGMTYARALELGLVEKVEK